MINNIVPIDINIANGIFLTIVIVSLPYFDFFHLNILFTSSSLIRDRISSVVVFGRPTTLDFEKDITVAYDKTIPRFISSVLIIL